MCLVPFEGNKSSATSITSEAVSVKVNNTESIGDGEDDEDDDDVRLTLYWDGAQGGTDLQTTELNCKFNIDF